MATAPASTSPSANTVPAALPAACVSAPGNPAPVNPWMPDPLRVSSAAPAISTPTPKIAARAAPAAVSQRPC